MTDAPRDPTEVLRNVTALEAAEQRAFERGQSSAKFEARVAVLEGWRTTVNGSIDRHAKATRDLTEEVSQLKGAFERSIAIAAARAQDAKEAAEKSAAQQVSTRTFVFWLIGAVIALGSLIVGVHP